LSHNTWKWNNEKSERNYWVFQGNPKSFDIDSALRKNELEAWSVKAHREKIKSGDKFILWITGEKAGCYGLGKVTSEPSERTESISDQFWIDDNKSDFVTGIEIEYNLVYNPILKDVLDGEKDFESFKGGNQGTNFSSKQKEYDLLLDFAKDNDLSKYELVKQGMRKGKLKLFLSYLKEYISSRQLQPNDERISFSVRKTTKSLALLIGNSYAFQIYIPQNKTQFSFIYPEVVSTEYGPNSTNSGKVESYWNVVNNIRGLKEKIFEGLDIEMARNHKNPYRRHSNKAFENEAFGNIKSSNPNRQYWIYAPGESAKKWEEFYEAGVMGFGWDYLGDLSQYSSSDQIKSIIKQRHPKKDGSTMNYNFAKKMKIGDVVFSKKGKKILLGYGIVTSDYFHDTNSDEFKSRRKINWMLRGEWQLDFELAPKTLEEITRKEPRENKSKENLFRIMGVKEEDINTNQIKASNFKLPLNTILYGPPGTGKTYRLQNEYFKHFTDTDETETIEDHLEKAVSNLSWWETIGVALLDVNKSKVIQLLEHPFIKAKAKISTNRNLRATLWGQMQVHTIPECEYVNVKDHRAPYIFNKTKDSEWEIVRENIEEETPELVEILNSYKNFTPNTTTKTRYVFTTFHQSFGYEDFIEGIKPLIDTDEETSIGRKSVYYDIEAGIFKEIAERAKKDPANNYAIFIDEINRGNIANIFGELITLIEPDKRIGAENELTVQLPYSKIEFGVPKNLYIVGTMNTADRSVEALDTALRRRFAFDEMNPQPELLNDSKFRLDDVDLKAMLGAINGRIEKLLDKDYCIGHSYFMDPQIRRSPEQGLRDVFKNKIIPLLQEYFYGDWGKIMLVLGDKFVQKKDSKVQFMPNNSSEDYEEFESKTIYDFTDASSWTIDAFKSIYGGK